MSAHVPVTAEELAEIARLHAAATEGEWGAFEDTADESWSVASDGYAVFSSHGEHVVTQADAEFAELCHEVVPRLARDLAERTAERDAISDAITEAGIETRGPDDTLLERVHRLIADANQIEGERDTLARVLESRDDEAEKSIRAESAIRNDERQRAKAEHEALADEGRRRDANRIERLEGELARLRVIVDDADKAKAEHAATRDELRRLHDVLSGERPLTK